MNLNGKSPFRAANAVIKGLTGCCVAVRLVLVTVEVVVLVTVLPVADLAAGRGAVLPGALRKNTKKKLMSTSERVMSVWCLPFKLSILDAFHTFRYFSVWLSTKSRYTRYVLRCNILFHYSSSQDTVLCQYMHKICSYQTSFEKVIRVGRRKLERGVEMVIMRK